MFLNKTIKIIKWFISSINVQYQKRNKSLKIRNYFLNMEKNNIDDEILEIIEYFKDNQLSVFPYNFTKNYLPFYSFEIKVYHDKISKMKYVLHKNKRLYFPKTWNSIQIRLYYNMLCKEQDIASPHRYETLEYTVKNGDIIADIGAAEGIWALAYAGIAAKIYLFECSQEWITALEKTFEPWKENVVIVNKFISNITQYRGGSITLDDFINGEKINFIKADIEGMELKLLEGAAKTLAKADDLKLLLCTYHRKDDADNLRVFLERKGYITEYSKGYMLFWGDENLEEPYLRRGLIRATKIKESPDIPFSISL